MEHSKKRGTKTQANKYSVIVFGEQFYFLRGKVGVTGKKVLIDENKMKTNSNRSNRKVQLKQNLESK